MPKRFLRLLIVSILLGAIPSLVSAQTPVTPASKLVWDIVAPDLATVNAYTWKSYADNAATGTALSGVTCVAAPTAGSFTCTVAFPAFTPGTPHTIQVSASNAAGEGVKSDPLSFTFIMVPNKPTNLRGGD